MPSPIPWSEIKVLSWDIFGTVTDQDGGRARAARSTALGPYLPASDAELLEGLFRNDTAVQREQPDLQQNGVLAEGLRRYAVELHLDRRLSDDELARACSEHASHMSDYPAFPDSVAAMRRLSRRFRLVPLTNVDNAAWARTAAGPLAEVDFAAVYTAEDIGSYKPDHRNFEYLLEHLEGDFGVHKSQVVHVAQSLFHDHAPARDFGLLSVWVDRGPTARTTEAESGAERETQEKYGYELRVTTLAELADIIDEEIGKEAT